MAGSEPPCGTTQRRGILDVENFSPHSPPTPAPLRPHFPTPAVSTGQQQQPQRQQRRHVEHRRMFARHGASLVARRKPTQPRGGEYPRNGTRSKRWLLRACVLFFWFRGLGVGGGVHWSSLEVVFLFVACSWCAPLPLANQVERVMLAPLLFCGLCFLEF